MVLLESKPPGPAVPGSVHQAVEYAAGVAAAHADNVDRQARFPTESIEALRRGRLLTAAVPLTLGGLGLELSELAHIAETLACSCASTAMIWSMQQIMLACIARHAEATRYFEDYLRTSVDAQLLIASVTSEVGVGGDIRSSIAALEDTGMGQSRISKRGSTISYGAYADAFLITARRNVEASPQDQVLFLLPRDVATLEQTGEWDTLGMRATCSPGFRIDGFVNVNQILPVPFADICAETMVPFSHVLWSACWLGIASDAVRRARALVRKQFGSGIAVDPRLADLGALLQQMRATLLESERRCESADRAASLRLAIEMNHLKLAASDLVVRIVSLALSIVGMSGYLNDSPYSLGRHLRDAYSAGLMINNQRLREMDAQMLLIDKAAGVSR
jgi:acyl-CoA dehydrogenase